MAQKNLKQVATTNAFSTTLNGSITDSDTSITLNSVTGLQAPGILVIDRQDGSGTDTPSKREYIYFTSISSNDVVLPNTSDGRGQGGSTAQSHDNGALVEEVLTVDHWGGMYDSYSTEHTDAGKHVISNATITSPVILNAVGSGASIHNADLFGSRIWNSVISGPTIASPTIASPTIDIIGLNSTASIATADGTIRNSAGNVVVGRGILDTPYKASAYLSADQSNLTKNTNVKILFDTEDTDPNSAFDAVTNHRYTVQVAGTYLITGVVTYSADVGIAADILCEARIYKNGTGGTLIGIFYNQPSIAANISVPFYRQAELVVGDYIEIYGRHNHSADSIDVEGGSTAQTHVAIHLLSIT